MENIHLDTIFVYIGLTISILSLFRMVNRLEKQVESLNRQVAELQNEFPDKIYD